MTPGPGRRGAGPASILLVRHGIAVPSGTPGIADPDRPLTRRGVARTRAIARALARLELDADRLLTSPLPRAARTAEILADAWDMRDRLETCDWLAPDADGHALAAALAARTERRLVLVGHNDGLSELVGVLAVGRPRPLWARLRKGGAARLRRLESDDEPDRGGPTSAPAPAPDPDPDSDSDPARASASLAGRFRLDWLLPPRVVLGLVGPGGDAT